MLANGTISPLLSPCSALVLLPTLLRRFEEGMGEGDGMGSPILLVGIIVLTSTSTTTYWNLAQYTPLVHSQYQIKPDIGLQVVVQTFWSVSYWLLSVKKKTNGNKIAVTSIM